MKTVLFFYDHSLDPTRVDEIESILSAAFSVKRCPVQLSLSGFGGRVRTVLKDCKTHLDGEASNLPHICAVGISSLALCCLLRKIHRNITPARVVLTKATLHDRFPWRRLWERQHVFLAHNGGNGSSGENDSGGGNGSVMRRLMESLLWKYGFAPPPEQNGSDGWFNVWDVWNEMVPRSEFPSIPLWRGWLLARGIGRAGLYGFKGRSEMVYWLTQPDASYPAQAASWDRRHPCVFNVKVDGLVKEQVYLRGVHAEDAWLPFLLGFEPVEYWDFLGLCLKAATLIETEKKARNAGDTQKEKQSSKDAEHIGDEMGQRGYTWLARFFGGRKMLQEVILHRACELWGDEPATFRVRNSWEGRIVEKVSPAATNFTPEDLEDLISITIRYIIDQVAKAYNQLQHPASHRDLKLLRALMLPEAVESSIRVASNL